MLLCRNYCVSECGVDSSCIFCTTASRPEHVLNIGGRDGVHTSHIDVISVEAGLVQTGPHEPMTLRLLPDVEVSSCRSQYGSLPVQTGSYFDYVEVAKKCSPVRYSDK